MARRLPLAYTMSMNGTGVRKEGKIQSLKSVVMTKGSPLAKMNIPLLWIILEKESPKAATFQLLQSVEKRMAGVNMSIRPRTSKRAKYLLLAYMISRMGVSMGFQGSLTFPCSTQLTPSPE